jgi:hypothetical protein
LQSRIVRNQERLEWSENGRIEPISSTEHLFCANVGARRLTSPPILGIFRRFDKSRTVRVLESDDSAERFPDWVRRKAGWQAGAKPQRLWVTF